MKHVAVWLLLLAIPGFQAKGTKRKYKGPQCLGPFCFSHPITRKRIPEMLGEPARKGNPYCYQSSDGKAFLNLRLTEEYYAQGGVSTEMVLSDFPNCTGKYGKTAISTDPLTWKTKEGIGLGSDEQDVLRAYGRPPHPLATRVDMSDLVLGYGEKAARVRRYASKLIGYSGGDDELEQAAFYIRDGKVVAITMGDDE
jgi:hypothetical protein